LKTVYLGSNLSWVFLSFERSLPDEDHDLKGLTSTWLERKQDREPCLICAEAEEIQNTCWNGTTIALLFALPEIFTKPVVSEPIACAVFKNDGAMFLIGTCGIHTFKFGFEPFTQVTTAKFKCVFTCHGEHTWIGLDPSVASACARALRIDTGVRP